MSAIDIKIVPEGQIMLAQVSIGDPALVSKFRLLFEVGSDGISLTVPEVEPDMMLAMLRGAIQSIGGLEINGEAVVPEEVLDQIPDPPKPPIEGEPK